MNVQHAIEKAAEIVGSQEKLAGLFGFKKAAVTHWKTIGYVPPEHCPEIERVCGGSVLAEWLCPGENWVRIKDLAWPNSAGRPLIDYSDRKAASAQAA